MSNSSATKSPIKKIVIIVLVVILVIGLAIGATALITYLASDITSVQAQEIAEEFARERAAPGADVRATTPDLDWEFFRWVWYVEVFEGQFVHEIYIHANTGAVLRHEMDRD
jgi:hypothetical protein